MHRAKAGQVPGGGEVRSLATLSESIIHFTFPIVLLMSQGRCGEGDGERLQEELVETISRNYHSEMENN